MDAYKNTIEFADRYYAGDKAPRRFTMKRVDQGDKQEGINTKKVCNFSVGEALS
jgi:hypothetical protein